MKRSGPRGEDAGVQLFPFLAVLICTMGAMVLVLVLLSHRAKQAAAAAATAIAQANKAQQAAAGPNADEAKEAAEVRRSELEWRIEQMRTIREKTAEALADKRLELANLEQHARQLRSELTQLKQTAETVEPAGVPGGSVRGELEENLRQLQGALVQKRVELADAVHARNGRPRGYAIVPYVGPNGTRRRPIYLECLIDRIVFQPEGIELTEEDFQGPIGPQNPLAAGVRAAVDYLSQSTTAGAESGEPYPLLIVRPDGIGAYYAARRALTSWTTDFGYELVENDWKLEYPPADPALAKNVTLAVVDGQQRQRLLAQVMPREKARARYHAGSYHGIQQESAPDDNSESWAAASGKAGGPTGQQAAAHPRYPATPTGQQTMGTAQSGQPAPRRSFAPPTHGKRPESADDVSAVATDQPPPPIHVGEYIPRDRERVPDSLAKKRGKDWGLPGSARNSISITRPVRLQCYGDRLVIYGEQGGAATAKNVPLGARTEDCVEALVSSMWERIGAWGLAGQGMYWRPIMQVEVMPGGEQRFAELESLFRDSGLDMQQRNTPYAPSQNALHEQIER